MRRQCGISQARVFNAYCENFGELRQNFLRALYMCVPFPTTFNAANKCMKIKNKKNGK